jgi:phosphoribosylformylglycinamidine cyclo-ligase
VSASYQQAGVSLAKAVDVVERLRAEIEATNEQGRALGYGAFAGLYALDDERLLAATTDSVGTKLMLSHRAGRLRDAGRDLAAHCVNDVLTTGGEPLFLLDYVAGAALDLDEVAELVGGAADVCREAGCALLGGETAELPGVYREAELDFVGTCVGLVRRADLIDGARCAPGDVVLGLPASGLHTNGFSLVRALLDGSEPDDDVLLAPHRLYAAEVRALKSEVDVKALAHVTGGGILGNLVRVLPEGVRPELDWEAWERPPVYRWLSERGVTEDEQRRVFNLGVGMCAVVPAEAGGRTPHPVIGRLMAGGHD